jgi:hypothetical protein
MVGASATPERQRLHLAELISLQHGARPPGTHDSAVRVGQYL